MTRPNLAHAVILPLEGNASSLVQDVAKGMIAAAKRFGMPMSLGMNGTRLLAFPTSTLAEIRRDYEAQLAAGDT